MSSIKEPSAIQVDLGTGRSYTVTFAPLSSLPGVIRGTGIGSGRCVVVTDENVGARYGGPLLDELAAAGFQSLLVTLPAGETTKSFTQLQRVYDSVLQWGVERRTPVIALGGGVVGDLAGFAAATLLRGLPLFQVPTTLVAQVDSAIGGKTGINHGAGKNLIGSFYQPEAVLADASLLQTLPEREWTSGLAEVVKHGLIADERLFSDLEASWEDVLGRRPETIDRVVPSAARVKTDIVGRDELEGGLREILNFGHTFAHAIEKVSGYGTYTHGEAVAAGMRAALHLSKRLSPELERERADRLVERIPVPGGLAELGIGELMAAMRADKKVRDGRIRLVLLERIGHAYVTDRVGRELVEDAWAHARRVIG